MILEIDSGNTLFKWRLFDPQRASATEIRKCATINQLVDALPPASSISRCRVSSVRGIEETQALAAALERSLGVNVDVARSTPSLEGVRNGYRNPEQLGVDRWLAVVAAFHLASGPCLVVDMGTAITVDLVDARGVHLGGYITPGLGLMECELLRFARGMRFPLGYEGEGLEPGKETVEAVVRGCRTMVRSYLLDQILRAKALLGVDMRTFATGGDAALYDQVADVQVVPDLVFQGLAYACP